MPSKRRSRVGANQQVRPRIPVVDLFAGPGGLSDGFMSIGSLYPNAAAVFDSVLAYEENAHAVRTLRFRKLFHAAKGEGLVSEYLDAIESDPMEPERHLPEALRDLYTAAHAGVRDVTLQDSERVRVAKEVRGATAGRPWVLLGGPPCQAYSLVGRSRNRGIVGYDPAKDERNTLYEEFLHVLATCSPHVFVLENVKGLLSATVKNRWIFGQMLSDLAAPGQALGITGSAPKYRLYSLSDGSELIHPQAQSESEGARIDLRSTVVRMEDYGAPQARHRVLLLGVRADLPVRPRPLERVDVQTPIEHVISDLPAVRSRFSDRGDGPDAWIEFIRNAPLSAWRDKLIAAVNGAGPQAVDRLIRRLTSVTAPLADCGAPITSSQDWSERTARSLGSSARASFERDWELRWRKWFRADMGRRRWYANHETRGHMREDLLRYLFASSYASLNGKDSPRIRDFPEALYPKHKNIDRAVRHGLFADRFRVQLAGKPSTTITSHIHKDGHYFIHFDPTQARSFTVREAARVQTFPDSYVFLGPRTEQFRQVGNAVPPYVAAQVADIVVDVLQRANKL